MPRGKYPRKKKTEENNKVPIGKTINTQAAGVTGEKLHIANEATDYCNMYYKARAEADEAIHKVGKLSAVVYHLVNASQHSAEAFRLYANLSQY